MANGNANRQSITIFTLQKPQTRTAHILNTFILRVPFPSTIDFESSLHNRNDIPKLAKIAHFPFMLRFVPFNNLSSQLNRLN